MENIFDKETDTYCLKKIGNKHYMLFSSYLSINNEIVYIVNVYDITKVYNERDRQMQEILYADLIILAISSIFISIFSILLTKPIEKLNETSKKIATGNFNQRVKVKGNDEIGQLAESFNIMTKQIESKVNSLNLLIKQKNDFINRIYT